MAADEAQVMEVLAGEHVLGTLDAAERQAAFDLMARDAVFCGLVWQWEARLAALAEALPEQRPAPALKDRIMARIGAAADSRAAGNVVQFTALGRQVKVWRGVAAAATALAAGLAAVLLVPAGAPAPQQRYVAVLQPDGKGAAFLASIDLAAGSISVRRMGAAPEAGKSHELWAIGGGRDKPQSLGVVDAGLKLPAAKHAKFDPATVFAISLEPAGGSPTGQPTGPVLYTGTLVQTE